MFWVGGVGGGEYLLYQAKGGRSEPFDCRKLDFLLASEAFTTLFASLEPTSSLFSPVHLGGRTSLLAYCRPLLLFFSFLLLPGGGENWFCVVPFIFCITESIPSLLACLALFFPTQREPLCKSINKPSPRPRPSWTFFVRGVFASRGKGGGGGGF